MNKVLKRLVILTLTLAVVSGCGKKGVTVTPEPPPPPAAETVETAPEPVHTFAEPDSFLEVDVDEVVRKAFETVYFEYDQFTLSPAATASLEKAAAAMKEHLNLRVMAEGHADERGTSQYNVGLGESRAQAVRNYLVTYGINGARLELTSYGKERPANPNCDGDDPCHSKNRRVEWRIIGK